jgi:hypothetical protein
MQINAHTSVWRGPRHLVTSAVATVIMASANAAMASGDRTIVISGNSTVSDCGVTGSDFAVLLTGDLEGCLSFFVQGFTCKELNGFDRYTERGREVFVGTLRGKRGRFATDYVVDGAYAQGFCQSFDFTLQLNGSCIHKIDGRSGVFADAEGVIKFFDVITNVTGDPATGTFAAGSGANNFLYAGRIRWSDTNGLVPAALEDAAPAKSRSSAVDAVAAQKARSGRSC